MTSDEDALRTVNRSFYGAIEEADVDAMRRVWSPEQVITCVHPRCQMITGWDDVIESWRVIFEEISPWQISVEEQRLDVRGDLGCVICLERYELEPADDEDDDDEDQARDEDEPAVEAGEAGAGAAPVRAGATRLPGELPEVHDVAHGIHVANEGEAVFGADPDEAGGHDKAADDSDADEEEDDGVRLVVATHIFFREDGQWRLAHRHASPYTEETHLPDDLLN